MKRLGYTQFVAQGGDWGAVVTDLIGVQAPPELLGIHTNMAGAFPPTSTRRSRRRPGAGRPVGRREKRYEQLEFFYQGRRLRVRDGAARRHSTGSRIRPSAWRPSARSRRAQSRAHRACLRRANRGLTPDDVLDNVTLYWLTNTASRRPGSIGRTSSAFSMSRASQIPVAVSAFPDEIYQAPRSWAERAYPNLIHYNKLEKGGHFAAWEQPKIFLGRNSMRASDRCATRSRPQGHVSRKLC